MATTTSPYVPLINGAGVAVLHGQVVRVISTNTFALAQADSAPHLAGSIGINGSGTVGPGGNANIFSTGAQVDILLETGLTPVAGQTVYVSATVAGRGTNVAPGTAVALGTIETAGAYARTGCVTVALAIGSGGGGGTGAQGAQGFQGTAGAQGAQGFQGTQGAQGFQGFQGTQGAQGFQGVGTASWTTTGIRIYAVDTVNGNDSNAGFATSADLTTGNYATACAAAGAVAKKTLAGLGAIFPQVGAGRTVEIVIANGGSNTLGSYTGDLALAIGGAVGYYKLNVRGTGTNTTASCTAFDGSTNDCTYQGAITATGLNATGYAVIGTPTSTVVQFQKVGGGAAGFAAEAAGTMPLGANARGDATGARNANVVRKVCQVTGTDTVTFATALTSLPQVGDVFYLEMPGVNVDTVTVGDFDQSSTQNGVAVTGLSTTSTLNIYGGGWLFGFVWAGSSFTANDSTINFSVSYSHPVRGTLQIGGCRTATLTSLSRCRQTILTAMTCVTTYFSTNCSNITHGAGFVCGGAVTITGPNNPNTVPGFGSTGALVSVPPRILTGGITLNGPGNFSVGQLDCNGTPTAFTTGGWGLSLNLAIAGANTVFSGLGGTYGFVAGGANHTIYYLATALPTITGGTFQLALLVRTITWASLGVGGTVDVTGVKFVQASLQFSTPVKWTGQLFGGAGAVFTYLADLGNVETANNTTPFLYSPPGTSIGWMRVKPSVNTMTQACTATIYVNGVATAVTVSIPSASTTAVSVTGINNVELVEGDTVDLRLDAAAADVGHKLAISAVVGFSA